jgi:lipoate synthase
MCIHILVWFCVLRRIFWVHGNSRHVRHIFVVIIYQQLLHRYSWNTEIFMWKKTCISLSVTTTFTSQVGKNIITSSLKYVLNVRVESFYQNNKEVLKSINDEITHIVFAMGDFFKYDAWKTREITFSYMWDLLGENLLWLCLGQWLDPDLVQAFLKKWWVESDFN